jgi:hypothetical protein
MNVTRLAERDHHRELVRLASMDKERERERENKIKKINVKAQCKQGKQIV